MQPTMIVELENLNTKQSRLGHGIDIVRNSRLLMWAAAATVSILSSRHLLVELNVHYPLHLHFLQLAVAGIFAVIDYLRHDAPVSAPSLRRTLWREWLPTAAVAVLMAVTTVASMQSILHTHNLPTLLMLAVISPGVEATLNLTRTQTLPLRMEMVHIFFIAIGCIGILLGEYKLLVPALQSAIPAVVLAGIARACRSWTVRQTHSACDSKQLRLLFCGAGLMITGYWGFTRDDDTWQRFFHMLQKKDMPLLILNCVATAVALLLGQSILLPLEDLTEKSGDSDNNRSMEEMLALVTMVATVGIWSTLALRRSYMTWTQFWTFLIAVVFIGCRRFLSNIMVARLTRVYSAVPTRHADIEDFDETEAMPQANHQQSFFRRISILFLAITIPSLWIGYLSLNFTDRVHQTVISTPPILDLSYQPQVGTELVISMYKERVDEVAQLISSIKAMPHLRQAVVTIYVKDASADLDWIRTGTNADSVTNIPNIGREGETYLHHITTHWDSLARHTIFLQADVHNPVEFYRRIHEYFDPTRTGMLNLGWAGRLCNCNSCGDRYNFEDTTHLFPTLHSRINNATKCENILLSYKGQFIASAQRIRGVDISVYQDLLSAFDDPNSWAHSPDYLEGRQDSLDTPFFGYTVERVWNLLMQCNDVEVAWKCASLVSGKREGGTIGDCQCFDPEGSLGA